jgi:hypothetical protein
MSQTMNATLTHPTHRHAAIAAALLLVGCAHDAAGTDAGDVAAGPRLDSTLRFRNAEVVQVIPEGPAIPRPAPRPFYRQAYYFDTYLGARAVRGLSPAPAGRARNVNALDQVPDDSWFENRIGRRPLTPADLRRGPTPAPRPPFRVTGVKVGGLSPGMKVKDAAGTIYLLKFDRPDDPEAETASDVILQRLLWAAGYHTPDDAIVQFRASDLVLDPRARLKDLAGRERAMTATDLTDVLSRVGRRADGSYRGLLSKYLAGVPIGGYPQAGVRPDDANDRVPHEDRRDVRGARVLFAWLNHVDMKEDNVIDTWLEDPRTPGRGHVRHNLVDFGNSLGVFNWQIENSAGFTHLYDGADGARALVSFGLWRRPWEDIRPTGLPGVGNLESARFDPARWQPRYPWAPFDRFDDHDGFWGARILMSFTPEHVAAAVAEGRFSDPRSAAYVARTLVERQRKLGRYYLGRVSALDDFRVGASGPGTARLCFRDLLAEHFGASEPALIAGSRHRAVAWNFAGRPLPLQAELPGARSGCIDRVPLADGGDEYTIVDVTTRRPDGSSHRVLVHLARALPGDGGQLRVIGVRRP